MIFLVMPLGSQHGWGVCGKYVAQELSRLTTTCLVASPFGVSDVGDELDYLSLVPMALRREEADKILSTRYEVKAAHPVLQCITDKMLCPIAPTFRGERNVGYTFFEDLIPDESLVNARRFFDHVCTGSKWCEEVLRERGLTEVSTVLQGVDGNVFHPTPAERRYFRDQFVIFSGGKLELRKSHDVVIRAVKILQDKYPDVVLIVSWNNMWPFSYESMKASPLVKFNPTTDDQSIMIPALLAENDMDMSRVICLGLRPNTTMARIYKQTDLGLFPNRCEGGSNLVMMEYMACGLPTVATFSTGQRDVLTDTNSLLVRDLGKLNLQRDGKPIAAWDDPKLDEVVAQLEFAYQNRDKLKTIGHTAGEYMKQFTWRRTAEEFLKMLVPTTN